MNCSLFVLILTSFFCVKKLQGQQYSIRNAHSHNDYHSDSPFYRAFKKGFFSIEADVYPVKGNLLVAHDRDKLSTDKTLLGMYIKPAVESLNGTSKVLQLLIDIKVDHQEALPVLMKQLEPYRSILSIPGRPGALTIVITGNRPSPTNYHTYPDYIWFDDDLKSEHTADQWKRVALVSLPFTAFSRWNGVGHPEQSDQLKLKKVIDQVHSSGKKIRFWAAPDSFSSWKEQMNLGVDLIGTDRIEDLGDFLNQLP